MTSVKELLEVEELIVGSDTYRLKCTLNDLVLFVLCTVRKGISNYLFQVSSCCDGTPSRLGSSLDQLFSNYRVESLISESLEDLVKLHLS